MPNGLAFLASSGFSTFISVAEIMPTKFVMPAGTFSESFMNKDPDFEERYTRAFMSSIEKNFDLSPASQLSKGTCFFLNSSCDQNQHHTE